MKLFGHKRPRRDASGAVTGYKESPAKAVTVGKLGYNHGCKDRNRQLQVLLADGDVIRFRPVGTRRTVDVPAVQAYEWALRSLANCKNLERARQRKEAKAVRLARQRMERAERRLFRKEAV